MANPVAGFPDATNTGVPAGTTLSSYDGPMNITTDGAVIENKVIDGTLRVTADNVVIKNCVINFDSYYGVDAEGAHNITIENCTITGPGSSFDSNTAILGSGQILNNNISETVTGLKLSDGSSTVSGNYIHDLNYKSPDMHSSALALQGGQDGVLIENNTLSAHDTSDIFIQDYFGSINDVTITHNLLLGDPGYNVYVEDRFDAGTTTNVSVTDNYIQKGYYGTFSVVGNDPTISGNVVFDQGTTPTQTIDTSSTTSDQPTTTTDQPSTNSDQTTTTNDHTTSSTTDHTTTSGPAGGGSSTAPSTINTNSGSSSADQPVTNDRFNFGHHHHHHDSWHPQSAVATASGTTADATPSTAATTDPYTSAVDQSTSDATDGHHSWWFHHHDASAWTDHFTV